MGLIGKNLRKRPRQQHLRRSCARAPRPDDTPAWVPPRDKEAVEITIRDRATGERKRIVVAPWDERSVFALGKVQSPHTVGRRIGHLLAGMLLDG